MPTESPPKMKLETWADWLPPGGGDPTDDNDDLITRDELLRRVHEFGPEIHPRTLQMLEKDGLVPRPLRKWHNGATRALYAPWVVDIVLHANDLRRLKPLADVQSEMRRYAMVAYYTYHMERDSELHIPVDILNRLRAIAYRHTRFIAPVAAVEIRFFNADKDVIAVHRHDYDEAIE